jgi:type II secretory pathway pseudopilin PulG
MIIRTSIANGNPASGAQAGARVCRRAAARSRRSEAGYLLLELILALIIFTVAVVALARSANIGIKTVGSLSRENDVRMALSSFLEEVRRKPAAEMNQTVPDERLGVTLVSSVDEITLKNAAGTVLRDLYKLRVTAIAEGQKEEDAETVEVWVYKPRTEGQR